MTDTNEAYSTPHWAGFQSLWRSVAIILFILLLLMWLLGYGPGGKNCQVPVKTVEKIVTAPDWIAPAITLNTSPDASIVRLTVGDDYVDAGAAAVDNIDGEVTVTTSGTVDTNTPGEYKITYTVTDAAGNTATKTRTVVVENIAKVAEPAVPPETLVTEPGILPEARLYFDLDSDELPADINLTLSAVISYLRLNSNATAVVSGYHDPSGNYAYNQDLAKRRAQRVSKLLQEIGVSTDRIVFVKPVETTGSNVPEEARRVDVSIRRQE